MPTFGTFELRCITSLIVIHHCVLGANDIWKNLPKEAWKKHGDSRIAEIEVVDQGDVHVQLPVSSLYDEEEHVVRGSMAHLFEHLQDFHFLQAFISFTGCAEKHCKPLKSQRTVWLRTNASEIEGGNPSVLAHASSELVLHTSVCHAQSRVWYLKVHQDHVPEVVSRTFMKIVLTKSAAHGIGGSDVMFVQQSSVLFAVPSSSFTHAPALNLHVSISEMQDEVPVKHSKNLRAVRVNKIGFRQGCPIAEHNSSAHVGTIDFHKGAGVIELTDRIALNGTEGATWYMLLSYQPPDHQQGRLHLNVEMFLDAQSHDYTHCEGSQCLQAHKFYNELASLMGEAAQTQLLACQSMHLLFPRRSFPYFMLASHAGREGRERRRWKHVKQACKLASIELGDLHAMMAIVAAESASPTLTATAIDKMQNFAASVLLLLSRSASKDGKLELAQQMAERACEVRGNLEDLDELAYVQMKEGKFSAAERSYRLLLLRHPSASAHFALGAALWADRRNVTGAIREFELGLQLDQDNAEMHVKLGMMMEEEGEEEGGRTACEHYRKAVELNGNHDVARFLLSKCLNLQGKLVESASNYRHLLGRQEGHCEARYNLVEVMHNALLFEEREENEKKAMACIAQQLTAIGRTTIHPLQSLRFVPHPLLNDIIDAHNKLVVSSPLPSVALKLPVINMRVGYIASAWHAVPSQVISLLLGYDSERTSIVVFEIQESQRSINYMSSLLPQGFRRCCFKFFPHGSTPSSIGEQVNSHSLHVLVDFDAVVSSIHDQVLSHQPAMLQVRGWGSRWPATARSSSLPMLASDWVATPPEFAASFTEKLILFKAPPLPPHIEQTRDASPPPTPQAPSRRKLLFLGSLSSIQTRTLQQWSSILRSCADLVLPDTLGKQPVESAFSSRGQGELVLWHSSNLTEHAVTSSAVLELLGGSDILLRDPVASKLVLEHGLCFLSAPEESLMSRISASFLVAFGGSQGVAGMARGEEEYRRLACSCTRGERREVHREKILEGQSRAWERGMRMALETWAIASGKAEGENEEQGGVGEVGGRGEGGKAVKTRSHILLSASSGRPTRFIPLKF